MIRRLSLAVVLMAVAVGASAQEATLEEVLQRHYETIGGLEAWQNLQTMKATGTIVIMGGQLEAPFSLYAKRPRMQRMEFTIQGMTGIQAFDGQDAWQLMPFMGQTEPEALPEDQAEAMREDSDIDGPLIGYQEEGIQLELVGTADVEGTPTYEIKVTMPNGDVRNYFLEQDYCLPIRVTGKREVGEQTIEFESILGDYKDVDGLVMAHSIEQRTPGMPQGSQTIILDSVEVNVELPDSLFARPASESGAGGL